MNRTISQTATMWNISADKLRETYASHAADYREMLAKCEKTGKKVNGYSANQLTEMVNRYEAMSKATDMDPILKTGEKY